MANVSTTPSTPHTRLVFPPLPLASGDAVPDADASNHPVTAVKVLVSVEGTSEPVEVALEYKFGGWWAPPEQVLLPGQPHQQPAGTGQQ